MVIRVGSWCQGLLKVEGKISAQRWQLHDGKWELVFRSGEHNLPCKEAMEDRVDMGDIESPDGLVWRNVD